MDMRFIFFPLFIFIVSGCTNVQKSEHSGTDTLQVVHESTDIPADSINNEKPYVMPVPVSDTPLYTIRTGTRRFTLHWISWDEPGIATIKDPEDGWYNIEGRQDSPSGKDYITISGDVKPLSDLKLLFRGTIEYSVQSINAGRPCIKNGEQVFLSTKGRRYWRLQNMQSCCGT